MPDINLLPQDIKPKESAIKISNNLKKLAILILLIFIVSLSISYAGIFFFNQKTKSSLKKQGSYKAEIAKLERTEQRLVLLKNRIDKINNLMSKPSVNKDVLFLENINSMVNREQIKLPTVEVALNENQVEIVSANLSDVKNLVSDLLNSNKFSNIYFLTFGYDQKNGYKAVFSFPK